MDSAEKKKEKQRLKKRYLRIQCDRESESVLSKFGVVMVRRVIKQYDEKKEIPWNERFRAEVVPEMLIWLSNEVLDCGFKTLFHESRFEIYRIINVNRDNWIIALHEFLYILLQVFAVIQNKTVFESSSALNEMTKYGDLQWIEDWLGAYEYWYTNWVMFQNNTDFPNTAQYLKTFILDSLDIVTAWFADYIGQRIGARHTSPPDFCRLSFRLNNCSLYLQPNQTKWEIPKNQTNQTDSDFRCGLRKREMWKLLDNPFPYDWLLEALDPPDRIKAMAHAFVTCKVKRGCTLEEDIYIKIGHKDRKIILRIPDPVVCEHTCTEVPKPFREYLQKYALAEVTAEDLQYYAYAHAHMTTVAGYDLNCKIGGGGALENNINNISTICQPQIVARYLYDREYKICCGKKHICCKRGYCEEVTATELRELTNVTNVRLENDMNVTTFPDFEKL